MFKLLYKLFRKKFNALAFNSQSKKNGFENMEKHFVDSKGNDYYRYKSDFDIPISRFKEIQKRMMLMSSGLSETSVLLIAEAIEKAINRGNKPDIAEVGFLAKEIKKRANVFIDTDQLMDTVCLVYIRQDETPNVIDWAIHKEKVEQLTIDSNGGLHDFFYTTGLNQYLPFVGTTEDEFNQFYKESEVKMKALQIHLNQYITG